MKKILLFIVGLLCYSNAFASTLTIPVLSNDSDVNLSYFNNMSSAIESVVNGNIESVNIKDDTIAEADMANDVNPALREGDHFNAYTKSGMLPADSANKTSDISAGTSYVKASDGKLYRVVTAATSETYTATMDSWVYIDKNGAFHVVAVTIGSAAPATPADSLLLATVTTDGTEITVVTDRRTTSITVGTSEDYAIKGFEIRADNSSKCSADAGVVYHGTTRIKKTTFTNLTVSTASDWWDGAVDTGVAGFYYIGVDASNNIKFLGINPPNRADTSGNTAGTKRYWYDGSKYWRVIGQIKVNASNVITPHYWNGPGDYYKVMWEVPFSVTTTLSAGAWSSAIDCSAGIPKNSIMGIFGANIRQGGANTVISVWIKPYGSTWCTNTEFENSITGFSQSTHGLAGQRTSATDASQQISHMEASDDESIYIDVEGYEAYR